MKLIFSIITFFLVGTSSAQQNSNCDEIVKDYVSFVKKYIAYYYRIKKNPESTSIDEYTNMDNKMRIMQDKIMKCVNNDISYATKEFEGAKVIDMMEGIVQVKSLIESVPRSTFSNKNSSNSYSNNNQSNKGDVCRYCNPSNKDGWHITDYNASNKTYPNSRYIKRPGYKPCGTCQGTGDCRVTAGSNGPSAYPMICEGDGTCKKCNGDRFVKCSNCNGSGKSN
jgi:hypothetical protein